MNNIMDKPELMTQIKLFVSLIVSSVISLFSPIKDILLAMLVLFIVNSLLGLLEDILHGSGWSTRKALSFGGQCGIYFGTIMSVFMIGHLIDERDEALVCVKVISIITAWVFGVNIFRNGRDCMPAGSSMHKLFDILYYVASVQAVEKIPFVKSYLMRKKSTDTDYEENQ